MSTIKVAVIQLDSRESLKSVLKNLEGHIKHIKSIESPHLVVLPELWPTGFNKRKIDQYFKNNEEKLTLNKLNSLAKKYKLSIIGSMPHKHVDGKKYNAIPLIVYDRYKKIKTPTKWCHKMALFTALHEDTELGFSSGMQAKHSECVNFPIVDIPVDGRKFVRIGLSICGELRYPEQFYAYAAHKCDLLINCSQWRGRQLNPDTLQTHFDHWEPLLKTRAIESQRHVLGVNRIGREGDYDYEGASMLIDPHGKWKEPQKIEVVPKSHYGEKIKYFEIHPEDNDDDGSANDLKLRRELSAHWFWGSTNYRLWDFLTYREDFSNTFVPFATMKPQEVDETICFLLMPLKEKTRAKNLKADIIRTVKPYGLNKCVSTEELPDVHLHNLIFEYIQKSGLIIADITGLNHNVIYEIGLAHALRKPTILIREIDDSGVVPFDINYVKYNSFTWKKQTHNNKKDTFTNLDKVLKSSLQNYQESIHPS